MLDDDTGVATETPSEPPPSEPTPPEEARPEAEVAEAVPQLGPWDNYIERLQALPEDHPTRTAYRTHLENETGAKARQVYESLQGEVTNVRTLAGQAKESSDRATNAWNTLSGRLQKAIDEGISEDALERVLRSTPGAWEALEKHAAAVSQQTQSSGQLEGRWGEVHNTITRFANLAGLPDLALQFRSRVTAWEHVEPQMKEFFQALSAGIEDKGYRRGLKEKGKVENEAAKAQGRDGTGPNMSSGKTGGRPTVAQYNAATPEQRHKWAQEGVEPIV